MKRILLDYDNTICDFNRMLVEKWKTLGGEYKEHLLKYEDITEYSLENCVHKLGYTKEKAAELINNFWNIESLYQTTYFDSKYRHSVISLLKELKEQDVYIELNTICNTFEMTISKMFKFKEDKELTSLVDNTVINTCTLYNKFKKSTDYDIVIDDNPNYIIHYLEEKPNGIIYMPIWNYNEFLIENKKIIGIN